MNDAFHGEGVYLTTLSPMQNSKTDLAKNNWDGNKPVKQNLAAMGLAADANQISKIQSTAKQLAKKRKDFSSADAADEDVAEAGTSSEVVQQLEAEVASFEAKQTFRFGEEDVRFFVLMLDRHGDDFKAMARDPKNLFQLTPKQLRTKITKFMSIPEQFAPYAKERGLLDEDGEAIRPVADDE